MHASGNSATKCPPRQRHRFPFLWWWIGLWSLNSTTSEALAQASSGSRVAFTNVLSVVYNGDNRNSRTGDVSRELDDEWGMVYNRLNAHATSGNWRFSTRVDGAWFYTSRSPTEVALSMLPRDASRDGYTFTQRDLDLFVNKFYETGSERNTRFTNWVYPSKYALEYVTPDFDVAAGDFYAQFGRGLVLSVRKQDELSSDNTIRGLRLGLQSKLAQWRVKFTGVAGALNPLRLDASSGRYLAVDTAHLSSLQRVTQAGMPRMVANDFVANPRPTYLPDSVWGTELELRSPIGKLSVQGVRFSRDCLEQQDGCDTLGGDLVRAAPHITQGGIAAEVPSLWQHAAFYVEYAYQHLSPTQGHDAHQGHALYMSLDVSTGSFTGALEAKHVRGYQTVRANIDTGRAPEFNSVVYNVVPTTEPIWNDTQFENFSTCVSGGRARADVDTGRNVGVFGWLAYYQSYGELGPAECDPRRENRTETWDVAQGIEAGFDGGKSNASLMLGSRFDDASTPLTTPSGDAATAFYRELYLRYDVVQWIGGGNSIQLQGWHRRRRQSLGGPELPWLQGVTTTALQWGSAWNFAIGIEYDQNPAFPASYFNGQLRYTFPSSDNVSLFVGQQQGGLRCVSGVCRVFPPFEGARLEATMRF